MKKSILNMKTLLMASAMMMVMSGLFAQQPEGGNDKADRIESLRVAFISQELNLNPAEAQKFWPVYNQYRSDMGYLRKNFHTGSEPLSATEQLDFEQKKLDLKKKYQIQFESTLGKEKCNLLYGVENKFQQRLRELRDQRQQQKGDRPAPRGGMGPR